MPVPKDSAFPKHQRWNIVQRGVTWTDIRTFAQKLVLLDGQILDGHHKQIIPDAASERSAKDAWLKIWVTIIQTLGLAYTADDGKTIHVTDLGHYVATNDDPITFYSFWAIRFQFPHGAPKQKYFLDNDVCIQPVVLLVEYFICLNDLDLKFPLFLTYDEIIHFCMKRRDHNDKKTSEDVLKIIELRTQNYDYAAEISADGYESVKQNLSNRSKLYFEPTRFFSYEADRITMSPKQFKIASALLSLKCPPIPFLSNTEEARNKYIRSAFSCNAGIIHAIQLAATEGKASSDAESLMSSGVPDVIDEQAEQIIQKEKKTKAQLLEEAKKYQPSSVSHKKTYTVTNQRIDNALQKARIKEIEDHSCQICGVVLEYKDSTGKTRRYTEAAHIQWKKRKGDESLKNIIILCPNCHKLFDYGCLEVHIEKKTVVLNEKTISLHHDSHLFTD